MATDRWLLTDKEIRDIVGEDGCNYVKDEGVKSQIVALAQDAKTKRKLVEWITSMGAYSTNSSESNFGVPKDEWQALREEVGLGE